jgi:hypothetical protein
LYPQPVHAVSRPEEAVATLRSLLGNDNAHDAQSQVDFARRQTWAHRAERFLDLLPKGKTTCSSLS